MKDQVMQLLSVDWKSFGKIWTRQMYASHVNEECMGVSPFEAALENLTFVKELQRYNVRRAKYDVSV
jgi:phage portal protein BeeE